ncbi:hypothetical protein GCM10020001_058100 [Nonomuraea salmonea]
MEQRAYAAGQGALLVEHGDDDVHARQARHRIEQERARLQGGTGVHFTPPIVLVAMVKTMVVGRPGVPDGFLRGIPRRGGSLYLPELSS